jgi:hypothetical protein
VEPVGEEEGTLRREQTEVGLAGLRRVPSYRLSEGYGWFGSHQGYNAGDSDQDEAMLEDEPDMEMDEGHASDEGEASDEEKKQQIVVASRPATAVRFLRLPTGFGGGSVQL